MRRSIAGLMVTLALGLLLVPVASPAPPLAKVSRIGFLSPRPTHDPVAARNFEAYRQGLRELG